MSADNGVYILKTGRQYRVAHQQAIDNLYWNENLRKMCDTMQPISIIDMFGDCKYTTNLNTAFNIARRILQTLPICEYGIVLLDAKMSWYKILHYEGMKVNDF